MERKRILVTGVLGFIGSFFAKYLLEKGNYEIIGIGRNSDQRKFKRIEPIKNNPNFSLVFKDLAKDDLSDLMDGIDMVIHFASKTFVNHSIRDPQPFIQSNVVGTFRLLEEARRYKPKLFLQFSTDEILGSILRGSYKENAKWNPSNPYSATKAAADALTIAYHNTYGLNTIITRTENNYGPYQHPQKALPTFCRSALEGKPLPVYGDGKHKRMWLHVNDTCRAVELLMQKGKIGEIYHIAGEQELENIELAKIVLKVLGKPEDQIKLVPDFNIRRGHDRRYALNVDKLKNLGWEPKYNLKEGLKETIFWYRDNPNWF